MRKSKKNHTYGQNLKVINNAESVPIYILEILPFQKKFLSPPISKKNTKNTFLKNAYFNLAPRKIDL